MNNIKEFLLSAAALLCVGTSAQAQISITEQAGWFETVYAEWTNDSQYDSYNVYYRASDATEFTQIDAALVRNYDTYGRADVLGLKAGDYVMKIVPVSNDAEVESAAVTTSALTATAHNREGFAHFGISAGIGAYNNDGTLKSGAKVFYVTKKTASTISTSVQTSSSKYTTCEGIQAIIAAYQKGYDATPIAFRIVGTVTDEDVDYLGSSSEGLQLKGSSEYQEMNITIEGVGDDAFINGFGFLLRQVSSVEIRNIGVRTLMDDDISLDTKNSHIWIHNCDLFYGASGSGDHAKGDGALDIKGNSQYITVAYNHFWDTGKSSMCGMTSESEPNYITYHHNWFDHSDSRHARIRTMSVHMYNNYYDGIAKYGAGSTMASSVFMEANYFRNCKFPMLTSMQGSDVYAGTSTYSTDNATFSKEEGGSIKSYNNVMKGTYTFIPYGATSYTCKGSTVTASNQNIDTSDHFDAYDVENRYDEVPETVVSYSGNNTYNNFDTDASLMYSYTPDDPDDVPTILASDLGAGRCNHGDISYTFSSSEDTNYSVISELKSLLDSYTTTLVDFYDSEDFSSNETGTEDTTVTEETKDDEYKEDTEDGSTQEDEDDVDYTESSSSTTTASSDWICFFTSKSTYTATDNYTITTSDKFTKDKGTVDYDGDTYTYCMKLTSSTTVSFTTTKAGTLTIVIGSSSTVEKIKIDGTNYVTTPSTESVLTYELAAGEHTIVKGSKEAHIYYISMTFPEDETDTDASSALEEVNNNNATLVETQYYNLSGIRVQQNARGPIVVVNRYSDGSSTSKLVIRK